MVNYTFTPMIIPLNRKKFFDGIKAPLFSGSFTNGQVNGISAILDKWEKGCYEDARWLAYMLATAYHEVAKTMQPIKEFGLGKGKDYGKKLKMGGGPGKRIPYTTPDVLFYGRGLVQLTWYENYQKMGKLLKIDLLNNPEWALQTDVAVDIMFEGMTKGNSNFGDFTGVALENYFNSKTEDWVNARKIINGLNAAQKIAGHAKIFYTHIKAAMIA